MEMKSEIEKRALLTKKTAKRENSGRNRTAKSKDTLELWCNIMAEGFRFMPLGLVRLRTFRLSAWVT